MKLFSWCKDGGPDSTVQGLFFIEVKSLFTVALLRFDDGSRDAYHSHAFNSLSWVLSGGLAECHLDGDTTIHDPGIRPVKTFRDTFHRVVSLGTTWVFTVRGPWASRWKEYLPSKDEVVTLTHGRKEVEIG